jgi:hypothetical protein
MGATFPILPMLVLGRAAAVFSLLAAIALSTDAQRVDTVHITRAQLAPAFDNPLACVPPDASRGLWSAPPIFTQVGQVLTLSGHGVVVRDVDAGKIRIFSPDGRVIATLGNRGAGPGEFSARSVMARWAGDTIAVTDPETRRLMLFTPAGPARVISLSDIFGQISMFPILSPEPDRVAFYKGTFTGQQVAPRFRPRLPIATWRPGDPATHMTVVRDSVPVAEMFMVTHEREAPMYGQPNFRRSTSFAVAAARYVLHDNARPELDVFDVRGRSERVIQLDVRDPPVTAAERDSVLLHWRRIPPPAARSAELVHKANEQHQWFPATRPAMQWIGTDVDDGVWVVFQPPIAQGARLYVRVTIDGDLDRCFRDTNGSRAAASARDRVVVVTELDEGDVVNVERTMAFPRN